LARPATLLPSISSIIGILLVVASAVAVVFAVARNHSPRRRSDGIFLVVWELL
jgi:hypothetical protein